MRRRLVQALAAACALTALAALALNPPAPVDEVRAQGSAPEDAGGARTGVPGVQADPALADGRELYLEACSSCHGGDLRGIPQRGPSLRGVGEASADFYLRTGRMPLDDPEDQPRRSESPYSEAQLDALVRYVGSFGGPRVPAANPDRGDLATGLELFGEKCMGCHQVAGQGGIMPEGVAPDLQASEAVDVAEALEIGPYVMPRFPDLTQREIDSLARYVEYTQDPEDRGGWGIGHIGPIPEGMVTWLLAIAALLIVIRLIGERTTP